MLAKGRRAFDRSGQFKRSFDADYYRSQLASIGMTATKPDLLEFYKQNAAARVVSPNAMFDEAYYLARYADVMAAVQSGRILSGFDHFVHNGIREGRFPNRDFEVAVDSNVPTAVVKGGKELDEEFYLEEYPAARRFIRQMPVLAPIQFFNIYGRRMGHAPRADANGTPPAPSSISPTTPPSNSATPKRWTSFGRTSIPATIRRNMATRSAARLPSPIT